MTAITKRPYSIEGIIGSPGNDASGDLLCIMAYTNQYQWVFHEENLSYYAIPFLPEGNHFCSSPSGTGINANGYFGDARKGNCLSQIKIRDND